MRVKPYTHRCASLAACTRKRRDSSSAGPGLCVALRWRRHVYVRVHTIDYGSRPGRSLMATSATAQQGNACRGLPSHQELRDALSAAQGQANGGFGSGDVGHGGQPRWRRVCGRVHRQSRGDQWPGQPRDLGAEGQHGQRVQPAGTGAVHGEPVHAVQPGGTLFGLQESNPVNIDVAYGGNPANYGQANDPMVGGRIGGINVFGGGLALYNAERTARRRDWCERRFVMRGSQHRLARRGIPRSRLRAWRCER